MSADLWGMRGNQAEQLIVQAVLAVEADGRRLFGRCRIESLRKPGPGKGRRAAEAILHGAERGKAAALQGTVARRDAGQDLAFLKQPVGLVLVVDMEVNHLLFAQKRLYCLIKPGCQAIGIDGEGEGGECRTGCCRRSARQILFKVLNLLVMPEQVDAGICRPGRAGPLQQDPAMLFFQLFDPLGNRRLGYVQSAGGLVEAALFNDGGKGLHQSVIERI